MEGYYLTISDIKDYLFKGRSFSLPPEAMKRVEECYAFLKDFARDRVIYGINTGFGPMAQWRVEEADLKALQYNIIRSHATGAGEPLQPLYVKAAMLARVGTFLQAGSGIHPEVIRLLAEFINRGIYPFIPQHGSVGASGDLVQLAHIALTLIGEGEVFYKGEWRKSAEVLSQCNLKPISIHIREGLSATNGTSVMTGIAAVNQIYAERLLELALHQAVWMNEIAGSYDDWMSIPLNASRRHSGQQYAAQRMREIAQGSGSLLKREHYLYNKELNGEKLFSRKVQAYYSLRCTPQILGPIQETYSNSRNVIERELNSVCDNPVIDPASNNVYHGGNFHGDYISLEQDKVKIATVRLTMTAERQLNYLCQFTATSTTAESQTLAMPNYVHSIPNNNDNQDIVSMGTNSALLCKRVIDNAYQVMAIHSIALAQATDCLKMEEKLAPATRRLYREIRELVPLFIEDTPFYNDIASVERYLREKEL